MISQHRYVRIDNRLLHGQVVQFWIPYLKIDHLVIADDIAASTPAMVSVYRMAVPKRIKLSVVKISLLDELMKEEGDSGRILVVLADIFDLARATMSGFDCSCITLGNVHSASGRTRTTDAVYLSQEEIAALLHFTRSGKRVEIQTFPGDAQHLHDSKAKGPIWLKS